MVTHPLYIVKTWTIPLKFNSSSNVFVLFCFWFYGASQLPPMLIVSHNKNSEFLGDIKVSQSTLDLKDTLTIIVPLH